MKFLENTIKLLIIIGMIYFNYMGLISQSYKVLLPPNYSSNNIYPLIYFLPGLGGNAEDFLKYYFFEYGSLETSLQDAFYKVLSSNNSSIGNQKKDFILVYLDYKGNLNGGLDKQINYLESALFTSLDKIKNEYSIDSNKTILTGFSLGGDLSFAICVRNSNIFDGAVIMSSRASYSIKNNLNDLKTNKPYFYFTMGSNDERLKNLNIVINVFKNENINYKFKLLNGKKHQPADLDDFLNAIYTVLNYQTK